VPGNPRRLVAYILTLHFSSTRINIRHLSPLANVTRRCAKGKGGQISASFTLTIFQMWVVVGRHRSPDSSFQAGLCLSSFPTSTPFRRNSPCGLKKQICLIQLELNFLWAIFLKENNNNMGVSC